MRMSRLWYVGGLIAGIVLGLTACPIQETSTAGGGPGKGDSGTPGSDAGNGSGGATGGQCDVQTTSGVTLCETISLCPSLAVSQNTFNQCGFRINGNVLDLECECSGYLCSAGTLASCAAAATVLGTETSNDLCNQLSTGGCTFEGLSGGTGTGSGASTCNTTCESQCVGDPNCIQGCGC